MKSFTNGPRTVNNLLGFTLVEVLVAAGIMSLGVIYSIQAFESGMKSQKTVQNANDFNEFVNRLSLVLSNRDACTKVFGGTPLDMSRLESGEAQSLRKLTYGDTGNVIFEVGKPTIGLRVSELSFSKKLSDLGNSKFVVEFSLKATRSSTVSKQDNASRGYGASDSIKTFQMEVTLDQTKKIATCNGGLEDVAVVQSVCEALGGEFNPTPPVQCHYKWLGVSPTKMSKQSLISRIEGGREDTGGLYIQGKFGLNAQAVNSYSATIHAPPSAVRDPNDRLNDFQRGALIMTNPTGDGWEPDRLHYANGLALNVAVAKPDQITTPQGYLSNIVNTLIGLTVRHGIYQTSSQLNIVDESIGIDIGEFFQSGTVNKSKDIYIREMARNIPGNSGNAPTVERFAIYSEPDKSKLYFAGFTGIGVNAQNPIRDEKLRVIGDIRASRDIHAERDMYADNYKQNSDARLKKDIQPLDQGLKEILSLKPVTFKWRDVPGVSVQSEEPTVGFIAQQVEKVTAHVVSRNQTVDTPPDGDPYRAVNNNAIIAILVKAVQEQQQIIHSQGKMIEKQSKDIETLQRQIP